MKPSTRPFPARSLRPALAAKLLVALALAACRPVGDAAPAVSEAPMKGSPPPAAPAMEVVVASSDLALGQERFAFGLMGEGGALVPDAALTLGFFHIDGDKAIEAGTAPARYYGAPEGATGLYVAQVAFDRAGVWGLEVSGRLADGRTLPPQRLRFTVAGRSAGPAVGELPPDVDQPVLAPGETDARRLSTDPRPDPDFYRLTISQAKRSGRPSLILFATPGLCQSEICLPVMDEVKALKARWGDRINLLHLEVYASLTEAGDLSPAMEAWGLHTEPWVYLLDQEGRVAARLEGWAAAEEVDPLLADLLR